MASVKRVGLFCEKDKKDKEIDNISKIIIDGCIEHWEELTAEVKDHKGKEVRKNNPT